jgi:hypothetical protein
LQRKAELIRGGVAPTLTPGQSCYVHPSVPGLVRAKLVRKIRSAAATLLDDSALDEVGCPDFVVVPDIAQPYAVAILQMFLGGVVCIPDVLLGKRLGPCVTYVAAVGIPRQVWMSERFLAQNAGVAALVARVVNASPNWTLLDSPGAFEREKAEAARRKVNSRVLGLVTRVEEPVLKQAGVAPQQETNVFRVLRVFCKDMRPSAGHGVLIRDCCSRAQRRQRTNAFSLTPPRPCPTVAVHSKHPYVLPTVSCFIGGILKTYTYI